MPKTHREPFNEFFSTSISDQYLSEKNDIEHFVFSVIPFIESISGTTPPSHHFAMCQSIHSAADKVEFETEMRSDSFLKAGMCVLGVSSGPVLSCSPNSQIAF